MDGPARATYSYDLSPHVNKSGGSRYASRPATDATRLGYRAAQSAITFKKVHVETFRYLVHRQPVPFTPLGRSSILHAHREESRSNLLPHSVSTQTTYYSHPLTIRHHTLNHAHPTHHSQCTHPASQLHFTLCCAYHLHFTYIYIHFFLVQCVLVTL